VRARKGRRRYKDFFLGFPSSLGGFVAIFYPPHPHYLPIPLLTPDVKFVLTFLKNGNNISAENQAAILKHKLLRVLSGYLFGLGKTNEKGMQGMRIPD
jgi:hypothetical protein